MNDMPWRLANASILPIEVSPTPRFGTLTTRLTETSSAGFDAAFR